MPISRLFLGANIAVQCFSVRVCLGGVIAHCNCKGCAPCVHRAPAPTLLMMHCLSDIHGTPVQGSSSVHNAVTSLLLRRLLTSGSL